MKHLASVLLLLSAISAFGQTPGSALIKKKQEKYYLTKTCYDLLQWDEVVLKNRNTENSINAVIRTAVKRYKLRKDDAQARCSGQMDYEPKFRVAYAKNGVLSYELTAYTYFKGGAHGGRQFENLNFDMAGARQISFRDLFDSSYIPSLDSIITQKLNVTLRIKDDILPEHYREQLSNPFFEFNDAGIDLNFIGDTYWTSVVGFMLTWQELRPYVKKTGPARAFYTKAGKSDK